MSDELLRHLAERCGVSHTWTDQKGETRHAGADSLRAILAALGLAADTDVALRNSLSRVEAGLNPALASRFTTARVGQPVTLPLPGTPGQTIEIELEQGRRLSVRQEESAQGALTLPPFDMPGYHTALLPDGPFAIATAPARCVTVRDLTGGEPAWGLAAQIYSLRTRNDGGIGNFAGVAAVGGKAAALGADAFGISPVHALFGVAPGHFSPYSPSTRLFGNPLHADPSAALPESFVDETIAALGIGEEMKRLSALPQVDWLAATPLRWRLMRGLFTRMRASDAPWRGEAETAIASASPLLVAHATFEALHAAELARDPSAWRWQDWRPPYRDPESAEVAEFARAHGDELAFQIFAQWLTARSRATAQAACRAGGMRIGLVSDIAIGMDASGSHAWSRQHEVLGGLSVGAPPDYYSASGQNWGLTTFSPLGLAASAFRPFIETLRANLAHVGGIRIDHVMGLSRLWLIPQGASAMEGAYVSFPSETLFRLVALESWRHSAIVIGEDLGTLPDGFSDYLREQGVAGMRVLRFENHPDGYVAPQHWDPDATAMTTTHDLIATAGWWAGADRDDDSPPDFDEVRAWERGLLWGSFRDAGLVGDDRPSPQDTAPVVDAAIRYVAQTPCTLKLINIEDALAVETQPNMPGTTSEKPNWRHRLAGDAGELLDDDAVRHRLSHLGPPREA